MKTFDEALMETISHAEQHFKRHDAQSAMCESPIEQHLWAALHAIGCKSPVGNRYHVAMRSQLAAMCNGKPTAFVYTQHWIDSYRLDFLVVLIDPVKRRSRNFGIEADGKGYHDPDRDEVRDAKLIECGVTEIIRMRGSRIYSHLADAMQPVCDILRSMSIEPDLGALEIMRTEAEERVHRAELRRDMILQEHEEARVEAYRRSLETGMWHEGNEAIPGRLWWENKGRPAQLWWENRPATPARRRRYGR